MSSSKPTPYPLFVRLLLGIIAILLVFLSFRLMLSLTQPSRFLNAYKIVKSGPKRTLDLQKMGILNFNQYLYLSGPIIDASNEKNTGPLFNLEGEPILAPSIFTDKSGAVEVLCMALPMSASNLSSFNYAQPVHMLGWRRSDSSYMLFAIAKTQSELQDLIYKNTNNWKSTLFAQGLLLAILVFLIFWLLNMFLLSTPSLQLFQLLIVNVIFLVLYYSVLVLSAYPLLDTLVQTMGIVILVNLLFLPIALFVRRKS